VDSDTAGVLQVEQRHTNWAVSTYSTVVAIHQRANCRFEHTKYLAREVARFERDHMPLTAKMSEREAIARTVYGEMPAMTSNQFHTYPHTFGDAKAYQRASGECDRAVRRAYRIADAIRALSAPQPDTFRSAIERCIHILKGNRRFGNDCEADQQHQADVKILEEFRDEIGSEKPEPAIWTADQWVIKPTPRGDQPSDYVLVPRKPTPEIIKAYWADVIDYDWEGQGEKAWGAMLDAAIASTRDVGHE
jgi:hypothetical protein